MSAGEAPNGGQPELIHLDRSSPSSVAVLLRLPEGNARSFVVASALGRFFDHEGSFNTARSLKEIGGSFIGPTQRQRVLRALDINARRWRDLVADWEKRYVAHRCGPGGVALFVSPLLDACPICNAYLEIVEVAPSPSARRRSTLRSGTNSVARTPQSGTNSVVVDVKTAAWGTQTVPPVGTELTHHISGVLLTTIPRG
jgi:hypothetical protein